MLGIQSHGNKLSMFQQTCRQFGLKPHSPSPQSPILYQPGEKSFRTWMDGSASSQLDPVWKGPLSDLLSSPTAIKVPGIVNWIHHSRVKPWKLPSEGSGTHASHTHETLEDLIPFAKWPKIRTSVAVVAVVQSLSCVWPCNPVGCSVLGSSVLHCLLELAQIHIPWVGDANQPSQ